MAERALVTGASSGIGRSVALLLAGKGFDLFLVARREARLHQVAGLCKEAGAARALYRVADLGTPGTGTAIVEDCRQLLGGLDVLICNAGYGVYGPVWEIPPEEMGRIWQVNYQSAYESIHAALPGLLEQGKGHIVLVSSILGRKALPMVGAYSATKFAQVGLGEALWLELRNTGVEVSVICPGYTRTEFQEAARYTKSSLRLRRVGGQAPEEVAEEIWKAIRRRKREVHLTLPGKLACFFNRLSPGLTNWLLAGFFSRLKSTTSSGGGQ